MNDRETRRFEDYRRPIFALAYRMLGNATEAEDIVQEAYLRYQAVPEAEIASHKAFLTTIVTRLCLNYLKSAKVQRESYVGTWLPEPVLTERSEIHDPSHQAELRESLSFAFLTLLERLTPLERAVFLLRKVFDYEYSEIASILGRTEVSCRKVFSRARKYISQHRPRFRPSPDAHRRILDRFLHAVRAGELTSLQRLLTEDITLWADGGGKVRGAVRQPLHGAEVVARFLLDTSTRFAPVDHRVEISNVNGEPAFVARSRGKPFFVIFLSTRKGRINQIRAVGNPDKLKWVGGSPRTDEMSVEDVSL